MDEKIYLIAEQIVQLHQKAYEVYLPLVEDVRNRFPNNTLQMWGTVWQKKIPNLITYQNRFICS